MASNIGLMLGVAGAAAIIAAPFTGGASLYIYGAGFALVTAGAVMSATPQEQEASTGVGRRISTTADAEAPWEWVYGDVVKGGQVVWAGIAGSRDQLMGIDIVLACHPCEELIAVQVGDWTFPITTNHLGSTSYNGLGLIKNVDRLTNPGGTPASLFEYPDDWYVPVSGSEWFRYDQTQNGDRDTQSEDGSTKKAHIALKIAYGGQNSTDAFMASKFPGYGDVDRKFIGHTVVHLILRGHSELGTLGGVPELKWRIHGKNNIALDGDGDPVGYTANCAAVLADFMKEQIGIDPSDILNHAGGGLNSLITECDDTTWHSSGGAARYEFHGVLRDDVDLIEACNLIATHMLGGYSERGDKVVFWTGTIRDPWSDGPLGVDDFAGPVETTQPDEDDWVNTLVPHFVPRTALDEEGKTTLYGRMEPTVSSATASSYVTEDGGAVLRQDIKFEGCPLSRRAVWMAQCALDQRRLGAQYTRRFRKRAIVLEVGDVYAIVDPERLGSSTNFRLVHKSAPNPVDFSVELTGQRYANAIYTQSLVSEDAIGVVPNNRSAIMPMLEGLGATIIGSGRVGANGRMTADVLFTWDDPGNVLVLTGGSVEIEWKHAGTNWPGRSDKAGAAALSEVIPGFIDGSTYDVRARFLGHPTAGRTDRPVGDWSEPETTFTVDLAAIGMYRPDGPPIGGGLGVNLMSDPYFLWPYDSTVGDGTRLGGYVTTDAGGAHAVSGSAEVVTGFGYWAVNRNGTIVKTSLAMSIDGDAGDGARLNVLEFLQVSPGQIYQVGCSLNFGSVGQIKAQLLLYDENRTFIANSTTVVIDKVASGHTPGKWYHKSAPFQVQPIGGVLPSFVRYQLRQLKYGSFGFDEVINVDGLIMTKINRAAEPYNPDDEETVDGTVIGSNYQIIANFGLPKTPQGGGFYASGDQQFSFEFTCDARVALAATAVGAGVTWSEWRMVLSEALYDRWAINTIYAVGDRVRNRAPTSSTERTYLCVDPGTSASSGDGPLGETTGIVDGGVIWDFDEVTPEIVISKAPNKQYARLTTVNGQTVGAAASKSDWTPIRLHPTYTPPEGFWLVRVHARLTPASDTPAGDPSHTQIDIRDMRLNYLILENEVEAAAG